MEIIGAIWVVGMLLSVIVSINMIKEEDLDFFDVFLLAVFTIGWPLLLPIALIVEKTGGFDD